nr:transposase [Fusobacterium pseudoperiodonticum]
MITTLIEEYDIKTTEDIQGCQNRPLEKVYPVIFIDATHSSVREDNRIKK